MTRLAATCAVLVLSCFLSACGGDDQEAEPESTMSPTSTVEAATSSAPTQTPTPTADETAALKKAVQAYSDAFLTGDVAAYDMLSTRCQERTDKNTFIGYLMAANETYGAALRMKSFKADVQGTLARVTYTYDVPAINQEAEPWVKESGSWREDDC